MAVKKISQFTVGTPTGNDYILFEQNGAGKSTTTEGLGKAIGINMDLLWTNASPTSAFVVQEIRLDLSKYKILLIELTTAVQGYSHANNSKECILLYVGFDGILYKGIYGDFALHRTITTSARSIVFGAGYGSDLNNDSINNDVLVPNKIYGVK